MLRKLGAEDPRMATPTDAELLAMVNQAIEARIDPTKGLAQSYEIDGRRLSFIPLPDLLSMKRSLMATARPTGGSRVYVGLEDAQ